MNVINLFLGGLKIISRVLWFNLIFLDKDSEKFGRKLRLSLESMGPMFIKFGQLLSTRTDLLSINVAKELQKLTDQCKPFSNNESMKIIESELGGSIEDFFQDFEESPFAAASLAQVHKATLKSNSQQVVIKILRPDIRREVKRNISLLKSFASIFSMTFKDSERLKPLEIVRDYEKTIIKELDLKLEASNTNLTRKNFSDSKILYIPEVYWDLSSSKMLVLEEIEGIPCTDIDKIDAAGVDKKKLAENGVQIFLDQVFRDNFFHADMHPGNIFVDKKNTENAGYVAVDCAICGSLTNEERYTLARMLQAVIKEQYHSLAKLFINAGWVDKNSNIGDLENTLRACCEPILEKPLSEIEFGKLLLYLFESTREYGLSVQPSLILLQKTLIHIEGMGRQIYPTLDFWSLAEPYLENWISEQFNPTKLKNYIFENKEEILENIKDTPGMFFEIVDEIRNINIASNRNNDLMVELDKRIKKLKNISYFLIALLGVTIIFLYLN